jgi:hypothetical protein
MRAHFTICPQGGSLRPSTPTGAANAMWLALRHPTYGEQNAGALGCGADLAGARCSRTSQYAPKRRQAPSTWTAEGGA